MLKLGLGDPKLSISNLIFKEPDDIEMEESKPVQTFIEGEYVRVYGIIKSLQGQKNVQAFKIFPLKDINEIANHMLECMNASICYFAKANGETLDGTLNMGNGSGQQPFAQVPMKNDISSSHSGLSGFQLNV